MQLNCPPWLEKIKQIFELMWGTQFSRLFQTKKIGKSSIFQTFPAKKYFFEEVG